MRKAPGYEKLGADGAGFSVPGKPPIPDASGIVSRYRVFF